MPEVARVTRACSLNESPSEKEGKFVHEVRHSEHLVVASMKVPPKRKGNDAVLEDGKVVLSEPQ